LLTIQPNTTTRTTLLGKMPDFQPEANGNISFGLRQAQNSGRDHKPQHLCIQRHCHCNQ